VEIDALWCAADFGAPPQMVTGSDGNLYAFVGVPGHFIRYDVTKRELTDLGAPVAGCLVLARFRSQGLTASFTSAPTPRQNWSAAIPSRARSKTLAGSLTMIVWSMSAHPVASDDGVVYCPSARSMANYGCMTRVRAPGGRSCRGHEDGAGLARSVARPESGQVYGERSGKKFPLHSHAASF